MTPDLPRPSVTARARPDAAARLTALAFVAVGLPFCIALVRILSASGSHVYLPGDLALIELHTEQALHWHQLLGPFDRFGWNHPGPSYYYLLAVPYRLLGSGATSLFFGATLINALAAIGTVAVIRRHGGAVHALWCAVCLGVLTVQLAPGGAANITPSEGVLGAVVSPWNPTVVIFPLVLFVVLCAVAPAGSPLPLLGALIVGSFIVQTDIAATVVVMAVFTVSAVITVATVSRHRHRHRHRYRQAGRPVPESLSGQQIRRRGWWMIAGIAVLVLMWLPPLIEQLTRSPGNLTLIYRFFTSPHVGPDVRNALWSIVSVDGMVVTGPSHVMNGLLGGPPVHEPGVALATTIAVLAAGVAAVLIGTVRRWWFPVALGGLSIVGFGSAVLAGMKVVGFFFGYLVVWEVAVPVVALIGIGGLWRTVPATVAGDVAAPARDEPVVEARRVHVTAGRALLLRYGIVALAVAVSVISCARISALPPLAAVSDPHVETIVRLVQPSLRPGAPIFVGKEGPNLANTEEFIGVVVQLHALGYQPKVNAFWRSQFGSRLVSSGQERTQILLTDWTSSSAKLPGFKGRVGDIAVQLTGAAPS